MLIFSFSTLLSVPSDVEKKGRELTFGVKVRTSLSDRVNLVDHDDRSRKVKLDLGELFSINLSLAGMVCRFCIFLMIGQGEHRTRNEFTNNLCSDTLFIQGLGIGNWQCV